MTPPSTLPGPRRGLVVFEDRAARGPLRCLRPGFRHCFCILKHRLGWLVCDPLKSSMAIEVIEAYGTIELARHLLSRGGRHVLVGTVAPERPVLPSLARPLTCVEIVKRLIGVTHAGIWTPRQLHRFLLARRGWQAVPAGTTEPVDSGQS